MPKPPQTLTEFYKVARFFTKKNWDPRVPGDKYGFVTNVKRGAQAYWYAYTWTAAYTVVPKDKAPAQGIYLFDPAMNPLVNTEGFVQGLTEYVQIIKDAMKPGGDLDRGSVITEITPGNALMSFDWGDTGPASNKSDSVDKDKLGFSIVPGTTRYYDWQTKNWVDMPAGQIHRAPCHAYNGWASYYITKQAKNPDAAWEWIKHHASPPISAFDVAFPDTGFQPWRKSHSTNLGPWLANNWSEKSAVEYIKAILDTTNDPNAVFDVRIPGAAAYGGATPKQAMDDLAKAFNDITDEQGKDN